jgi:hypothetical protein
VLVPNSYTGKESAAYIKRTTHTILKNQRTTKRETNQKQFGNEIELFSTLKS